MVEAEMKDKMVKGLFWKLLENGGAQGVQFLITILLARLLTPAEYGVVGIIMIFITIANVIVQNGFSTALIQKKGADRVDFSSVCYFDLLLAAIMYALLFIAAPAIADFYQNPILEPIVRILGVVLFPGAIISVQTAYVSRNLEFRGLFLATLAASVISGMISIAMAISGAGVWAMVGQQVAYYFALMLALLVSISWKPERVFSVTRIREMFSFGWKLLCASLLDTIFNNLYGLLIGKIYNEESLGSFNRGEQFPKLIATNLGAAIQSVLLPALAADQDNTVRLRQMVRRSIRLSSFVVVPMLLGLFAVADSLILVLLGEPWLICVPFLRIMCISYCFWPIHITNLQAINAVGRSDIFLKLEIIKKALSLVVLLIGMRYNVIIMVSLKVFQDFLCTIVNAAPNRRLLGYGALAQWRDMLPAIMLSAVMAGSVMLLDGCLTAYNVWGRLVVEIICGAAIYILLAVIFRVESLKYLINILRKKGVR